MLWTAEAVEDLKKLALEGKSASHISAALGVGSRNAVIGKASRIGIKLSGGGGASVRGKGAPRAARPQWAPAHYPRPNADAQRSGAAAARDPQVSPGDGRAAGRSFGVAEIGEMRRLRFEDIRESACRWPLGDPRSGDFAYCGLTPAGGPVLLRRPLPNGLSVAAGATDCAGARAPRHREFMAAVVRRRATLGAACRSVFSNTQIRPGASAPASRRVEADRMRSGRKPNSRAVVST